MSDESKVKMSAEGQITLPKWVRDRLGLNGGESFLVEEDGKGIIIEYWGMEGDEEYDARTKSKKTSYMEMGQPFISIRREDIKNINDVLKTKLTRLGVVFEK